ncbi:MAG: RNA pyrophosphohydrolase, partial [Roseiarcus sp.]
MLVNRDGAVFIGRRKKSRQGELVAGHEWQMPQGGVDDGEAPYDAALRELYEETNVSSTSLIAEAPQWLSYELPDKAGGRWRGRYRGQTQKWFLLR